MCLWKLRGIVTKLIVIPTNIIVIDNAKNTSIVTLITNQNKPEPRKGGQKRAMKEEGEGGKQEEATRREASVARRR